MTTIDPRAAAIEAAARAYYGVNGYDWDEEIDEGDRAVILREFTEVVAAAVNYGDNEAYEACARRLTQALDAIEAGATSEGGARCVTVTRRCRDGEWEGDDLPTPDEALRMGWSV